jgi:hypothetical protein
MGPHVHDVDILVLQLEGNKEWHFKSTNRNRSRRIMVETGDVLYVPKGTTFECTGGRFRSSLHLTLQIQVPRYATWESTLARTLVADQREQSTGKWKISDGGACKKIPHQLVDAAARLASSVDSNLSQTVLTEKHSRKCGAAPDICTSLSGLESLGGMIATSTQTESSRSYFDWKRAIASVVEDPPQAELIAEKLQECCQKNAALAQKEDNHDNPALANQRKEMLEGLQKWRETMKKNVIRHMDATYEW